MLLHLEYLCFKMKTKLCDLFYLKSNLVLLCNLFVFSSSSEWSLIAFFRSCRLVALHRRKVHHSCTTPFRTSWFNVGEIASGVFFILPRERLLRIQRSQAPTDKCGSQVPALRSQAGAGVKGPSWHWTSHTPWETSWWRLWGSTKPLWQQGLASPACPLGSDRTSPSLLLLMC